MEKKNILSEIIHICRETFEDPHLKITEKTTSGDIPKWDSLNHVMLIAAIEKKYNIKFDLDDMLEFDSIGDICEGVYRKTS
jgi:acyl carrier protein